ncbi:family 1 glycosylhydrolase [Cellulomonas endophytica]|uniref:family 1 glycosylhydrolase n=1 Tax=Cellulomonas endophytica TaxID=2494735 RepID=UPI001F0BBF98|nr:family 1 glycosylhydrolase [Cellulomonas endophytica]
MDEQTAAAPPPPSGPPRLLMGVGVEDTFVVEPHGDRRPLDEYALTDHYRRWSEDVDLLAATGADQVRWGIPWYRVHPEPGRFDWSWVDRVVARFEEVGVEPVVDLVHYGTPAWLGGGFLHADYPAALAEYAVATAERYPSLRLFTATNEPTVTAERCGEDGIWPPHRTGDAGYLAVLLPVARGVVAAQRAIAEVRPDAEHWHVEASRRFVGATGTGDRFGARVAHLREREFLHQDLVTGRVGEGHALLPHLRAHGVTDGELTWFAEHAVSADVLGVNYYPHVSTVRVVDEPGAREDPPPSAWPVTWDGLEGLVDLLHRWHARYPAVPLALTETADPGDVDRRVAWLHDSLATVLRLREEGLPLVGYTWWSLFDFLLWDYREGTGEPHEYLLGHGLWDLEPDGDGGFGRRRTAAADAFVALAAAHGRRAAATPVPSGPVPSAPVPPPLVTAPLGGPA